MPICAEVNLNPTNEFDGFNIDSLEIICQRNWRMIRAGKQPTFVIVGYAETAAGARKLLDTYRSEQA